MDRVDADMAGLGVKHDTVVLALVGGAAEKAFKLD
jgi:hypothetical protein